VSDGLYPAHASLDVEKLANRDLRAEVKRLRALLDRVECCSLNCPACRQEIRTGLAK
jgi:hypothetical protein